ncbi:hypothetical protein CARUB_v10026257mg [Capsella rubella]|uniref:HAT C-terminal dimerisation domain-containing protein n=1 Tax=Capsella rubella TaxID=81985 RepID=R0EWJ0_9BRAS|nr:hypothetical protein CARUB_v10026257mg [Capsella rubella]
MMLDADMKLRAKKIDQKIVREKFSRVLIRHDLPFSAVEYEELRDFLKYMNPDYISYTRNTAASDVIKTWKTEKEKLKLELENIPSRICLTSDCWTAVSGEGYISLMAHYVDEKGLLNNKILSFCDILPPHTGEALATKIHECLRDWGIEKKVFTLTLDNATANDTMQDILKERLNLDHNLLCEGEFFHVRCCAHILNLIVQDGLKVIGGALSKIRDSVKYVKATKARGIAFETCAFKRLKVVDKSYKHCPSNDDWCKAKNILEILKPFYKITVLMLGRSYSTSNLYFVNVWKIECLLKENERHSDKDIRDMAGRMRIKFKKYWDQYSVSLAMGAVLDPRMKFKLLKRCYEELDPSTCKEKLDHIEEKLRLLFDDYLLKYPTTASTTNASSTNAREINKQGRDKSDMLDDLFDLDDMPEVTEEGKSVLDIYLSETKLEMKNHPKMCVLQYWKDNIHRFGALSYMAYDILSIPITTVASESSFSIGSHVLNKYRSRLLPKHVQALLCTRS